MLAKRIDKRGLAIITTLLILTLLLGLIGAFLGVNRAGNRFTVSAVERRQAQDAALTCLAYAWKNLEADRKFATSNAFNGPDKYPYSPGDEVINLTRSFSGDTGVATGEYSPKGDFANPLGTVKLTIRNNLANQDALGGVVPQRSVMVVAETSIGGVNRSLEVLLRPQPPSNNSVGSGKDLYLDTSGTLTVRSNDPYVNSIRAGGDLLLPDQNSMTFEKHGEAISKDRLDLGGLNLATASDTTRQAAEAAVGGTFTPNVKNPYDVADFDANNLAIPPSRSSADKLPGGNWVFGDIKKYEYKKHHVQYSEHVATDPMTGTKIYKNGGFDRHQKRESTYNQLTSPTGQKWAAGKAIPGTTGSWYPPAPGTLDSEAAAASWGFDAGLGGFDDGKGGETLLPTSDVHQIAPGLKANVTTAQFVVRSGHKLSFSGDFIVTGKGDRSPELYFGYDMTPGGVAVQESNKDGDDAARDNPENYMGAIVANGNLNVTGGVLGYGSMIAGGDLHIKASSGLVTAPGLGVVVKGQKVIVYPSDEPEPNLPGAETNSDYPVLQNVIQQEAGSDWSEYEAWASHEAPTRQTIVTNLKTQTITAAGYTSPQAVWDKLKLEIPSSDTASTVPSEAGSWPAPFTLEKYVRLKEFYQTQATGYIVNGDLGDKTWLDLSLRDGDVDGRISNSLYNATGKAKSLKKTLEAFLSDPDPSLPDMYMSGLVYAEDDIEINTNGKTLRLEGAVVAKNGDVRINGASDVELIYDRDLLDDLIAAGGTGPIRLEQVFFTME